MIKVTLVRQDYWAGKWHVCCEGPILHKITPLLYHSSSAV